MIFLELTVHPSSQNPKRFMQVVINNILKTKKLRGSILDVTYYACDNKIALLQKPVETSNPPRIVLVF